MRQSFLTVLGIALLASCAGERAGDGENHGHDEADSVESHAEVALTGRQISTVGIKLGGLEKRPVSSSVKVNGVIGIDPQNVADVSSMMPGIVRKLLVIEGQRVKAGQTVALVENPEAVDLQSRYLEAVGAHLRASAELKRQNTLAAAGAGVARNLENARIDERVAAEAVAALARQLSAVGISPERVSPENIAVTVPVRTPVGGVVNVINVRTGSYVDAVTSLMTVSDNSTVFISLNVYENDIALVKRGQRVEAVLTNMPGEAVSGKVVDINPTLDPQTRTMSARVKLNPVSGQVSLVPGMSVTATVTSDEDFVDALPADAIVSADGRDYVFMLADSHGDESHFRKVEVVTGASSLGYTAVSFPQPVPADAKFVVAGAFYLSSMSSEHGEHSH